MVLAVIVFDDISQSIFNPIIALAAPKTLLDLNNTAKERFHKVF